MMAELIDMDVVNVPTYDGAQASATSIRMAARITGRQEVLVAENIHPETMSVIKNYCNPDLTIAYVPCDPKTGCLDLQKLQSLVSSKTAVLYFENPSFIGTIDPNGEKMAEILHNAGALMVTGVDSSSMGLLTPPSRYGADIVCGDIQPLGMHTYYGGARGGFMGVRDDETFIKEYPSGFLALPPPLMENGGLETLPGTYLLCRTGEPKGICRNRRCPLGHHRRSLPSPYGP